MIEKQCIERLREIPVADILRHWGVEVNSKGWACCPFHHEKTPSLRVYSDSNRYHCYGCGENGNGIEFVMRHAHCDFATACGQLGEAFAIPIAREEESAAARAEHDHKGKIYQALRAAQRLFSRAIEAETPHAQGARRYALSRFADAEGRLGEVGYCPWEALELLGAAGIPEDVQLAAGLRAQSRDGRWYCPYSGRVTLPIHNHRGQLVSFVGRALPGSKSQAKYLNGPETAVFSKKRTLYGLHRGQGKGDSTLLLVEGYADCLSLRRRGERHVAARMGTALSPEQVALIRGMRYDRVCIIPDTDPAGMESLHGCARLLIEAGLGVNVLFLPHGGEGKVDIDSYLAAHPEESVAGLRRAHEVNYLRDLLERGLAKSGNDLDMRRVVYERVAALMLNLDEERARFYLDELSEDGHVVRKLGDALRRLREAARREEEDPADCEEAVEATGLGVRAGRFVARRNKSLVDIANFHIEPLYYVDGARGGSRFLFRFVNVKGERRVVSLPCNSRALRNRQDFRLYASSCGRFSFAGTDGDVVNINALLNEAPLARELHSLGYQGGLWVWANGIFRGGPAGGAFYPYDEAGIAQVEGEYYFYEGALAGNRRAEEYSRMNTFSYRGAGDTEKGFRLAPEDLRAAFERYARLFCQVYGDNGKLALLYLCATVSRDMFIQRLRAFPLLNAFGRSGTGKTAIVKSLQSLFFSNPIPVTLPTSTMAALSAELSAYRNAVVGLDEYSGRVSPDKVELLKSMYDGGGRSKTIAKGSVENRVNVTAAVSCGVCLCGQQIPNADIALYTRVLMVEFAKSNYNAEENKSFAALHARETEGLGDVIHALVSCRGEFERRVLECFDRHCEEVRGFLVRNSHNVDDRTVKTWSVLLSTHTALRGMFALPFSEEQLRYTLEDALERQASGKDDLDDVTGFWKVLQTLTLQGEAYHGSDFKIYCEKSPIPMGGGKSYTPRRGGEWMVAVNPSFFSKYTRHAGHIIPNPIDANSLRQYLLKSDGFVSSRKSMRFVAMERGSMEVNHGDVHRENGAYLSMATKPLIFRKDALPIPLDIESSTVQAIFSPEGEADGAGDSETPAGPPPLGLDYSGGLDPLI